MSFTNWSIRASSSFTLSGIFAARLEVSPMSSLEIVQLTYFRIVGMWLESPDQLPIALADRNSGNQVRKPREVRLAVQAAGLLQNRHQRFTVNDMRFRFRQPHRIENRRIKIDRTNDGIAGGADLTCPGQRTISGTRCPPS